jgi:hypothetical protein
MTPLGKSGGLFQPLEMLRFKPLAPAGILLFVYFFVALLTCPLANLPFHDDWTYAWSVEHLLNTGELRILDWSVHYPFTQILWGTLFFPTLRILVHGA